MDKKTVLFCTGLSGSGKSYFVQNILPNGAFYNLKSATTRAPRDGEADGRIIIDDRLRMFLFEIKQQQKFQK